MTRNGRRRGSGDGVEDGALTSGAREGVRQVQDDGGEVGKLLGARTRLGDSSSGDGVGSFFRGGLGLRRAIPGDSGHGAEGKRRRVSAGARGREGRQR